MVKRLREASGPVRWWFPLLAFPVVVVACIDAYMVARHIASMVTAWDGSASDWHNLAEAAALANPYDQPWYRWSPVAIWLVGPITALGLTAWRIAQLTVVMTLRDVRLIAVMIASAPFWSDVQGGDAVVFLAVAAWHAARGSRIGTAAFLIFAMLIPRPLMLPLLIWLLWTRPAVRPWFVGLAVMHAGLVVATGLGAEWVNRLISTPSFEFDHFTNIAPSRWIGWTWIPIGAVCAVWLARRGRLGWASLAASPYVFESYLLMLVLEFRSWSRRDRSRSASSME
jgi:hypothetical protein